MALYAQIDAQGELQLVNHLGIALGDTPEQMLTRLEKGNFTDEEVSHDQRLASDHDYANGCAMSKRIRRRVLMPTSAACSKPPAAPENWRSSLCVSTLSRLRANSRYFISVPTAPPC